MKIYRLYSKTEGYKTIDYGKTPLMNIIGEEDWGNLSEIKEFPYQWKNDNEADSVSDCPFLIGAIPVFSLQTMNLIKEQLTSDTAEIIPISIENETFCILRAKLRVANLLNERKSKITRFSDGRIMSIEKYVFKNEDKMPLLFQLQQYPLFTFVTGTLADLLLAVHPTGLCMEECKIHKGWF